MEEKIVLQKSNKKALLYGIHTKAGAHALENLLQNNSYSSVLVFSFQDVGIEHNKIEFVKIENETLEGITNQIKGDDLFIFQENEIEDTDLFLKKNFLIPLRIALYAKHNNVNQLSLLSSSNTVLKSVFLPHKTKEELEIRLADLDFWSYYIYKPIFVVVEQQQQGVREKIAGFIGKRLNVITNNFFKKITPIETDVIIDMMMQNAQQLDAGIHTFNNEDILTFQESIISNI
jgi:hypothetical protein